MSRHTRERADDAKIALVVHRGFHAGQAVRVRADFDVAELAGCVGTVAGVDDRPETGAWVVVDLPGLGSIHFRAGEIEHVESDTPEVALPPAVADAVTATLLSTHADEGNALARLALAVHEPDELETAVQEVLDAALPLTSDLRQMGRHGAIELEQWPAARSFVAAVDRLAEVQGR